VFKPTLCVIAQGSKEVILGDSHYRYDPLHYLLVTIDLPTTTHVLEASTERPYLSFTMELPSALVSSVMLESGYTTTPRNGDMRATNISALDVNLQDAVLRLIRLLDSPNEVQALQPLISREIIYRLLLSDQGGRLSHLTLMGGYTPDIAKAVEQLRQNFDQPLRIDDVAREIGMSVSGFHHHFKAVTAMSPLQFQKQVRLQEARRLMLGEHLDAASAGYRVGYDDASYFNRDYKRLFGLPPMRDVERLREGASPGAN
jgi:AraC-like DNA-binding protein